MPIRFPTICDYRQMHSPLEKGLFAGDYLTWAFMPLRRIVPLRGTLSCAFGAALLQGPTRGGLSHMGFYTAATSCASSRHSILRLWRGPSPRAYSRGIISHGLLYRCNELCLFEDSILRLWRDPSPRAYSRGIISHGLSCRCDELCLFEDSILRLWRGPSSRAYSRGLSHIGFHAAAASCASSRHSILRLWRGPSPRAYSRGIISHGLSYRCDELCLFEALYPAPLVRPFSKGLLAGGIF